MPSPFIEHQLSDHHSVTEAWIACIDGTESELFLTPPMPGGWSAAECLHHVTITTELYAKRFKEMQQSAKEKGRTGTPDYKPGFIGKRIIRTMEPPPSFRMKTFRILAPSNIEHNIAELRENFITVQEKMAESLSQFEGINIKGLLLASVVSPLIQMPAGLWVMFNTAHTRRHLWQAEQAIQRLQAPPQIRP